MQMSPSIKSLSKALLVAQSKMGGATKGAKNPFFKSNYSDYNSVLEVVKEPLNEAGIIVLQPTTVKDGKTYVETTLLHAESGEFLAGEMEVVTTKDRDPQSYGSAVTYARRYALQSMLSIPSVDDDGEASMGRKSSQKEPPATAITVLTEGKVSVDTKALSEPKSGPSSEPPKTNSWRKPRAAGAAQEAPKEMEF